MYALPLRNALRNARRALLPAVVAGVWTCLCALPGSGQDTDPGTQAAGAGAAAAPTGRAALLVFLDYEENVRPVAAPGELRLAAAQALASELGRGGTPFITHPQVEPAMRSWGVRSAGDVPHDLLHTLGTELGVGQVVIAQVVLYRQRLLLLARGIDRATGDLRWADVGEASIPARFWEERSDAGMWSELVTEAATNLNVSDGSAPVPAASDATVPRLAVLPLRFHGLDAQSAAIAEHALLGALLATGHHRVPDPGLVRTVLRSKGFDPLLLGPAGRTELATWFQPAVILAPELLTFELWAAGTAEAEDFGEEDASTPTASARQPLYFQVVAVDGATGAVRDAQGIYLEPDDPVGLFGFERTKALADRYAEAAGRIVASLEARGSTL